MAVGRSAERNDSPAGGGTAAAALNPSQRAATPAADAESSPTSQPTAKPPTAKAPAKRPTGKAPAPKKRAPAPKAAPKKPAAKSTAPPAGTEWVQLTSRNSGTLGAPYQIASTEDYTVQRRLPVDVESEEANFDVMFLNEYAGHNLVIASLPARGFPAGALSPFLLRQVRAGFMKTSGATLVPGVVNGQVAGRRISGFDVMSEDDEGNAIRQRVLWFVHAGTMYAAIWSSVDEDFTSSLPAFAKMGDTMTFTGPPAARRAPKGVPA